MKLLLLCAPPPSSTSCALRYLAVKCFLIPDNIGINVCKDFSLQSICPCVAELRGWFCFLQLQGFLINPCLKASSIFLSTFPVALSLITYCNNRHRLFTFLFLFNAIIVYKSNIVSVFDAVGHCMLAFGQWLSLLCLYNVFCTFFIDPKYCLNVSQGIVL